MKENDGKHIRRILKETKCKKHQAFEGIPCFTIYPGSGGDFSMLAAVCGKRVRSAGYVGKPSPQAMNKPYSDRRSNQRFQKK